MKKLLFSIIFLLACILNIPLQAASQNSDCRKVLGIFVIKAQLTLVDPNQSYNKTISLLKTIFGENFYEKSDLRKFEDDVREVFKSKRNHDKNWRLLEEKWNLNSEEGLYLKAFYSFFIYEPSLLPLKIRKELFGELKKLSLGYQLNTDPFIKQRYAYYQSTIGKKSVPEIAIELGISQSRVYRELSYFNLSIVKAFENDFRNGEDQSSRFVRHQREIESRGVSWNRNLGEVSEEILLVDMHEKGMTHAQIAMALNKLAGTSNPNDPNIRTERSVSYKVQKLGLSKHQKRNSKKLTLKDYGLVKENGYLIPSTTIEFLITNKDKGKSWCAQKLKVSLSGLSSFIKRHHLEVFFEKTSDSETHSPEITSSTVLKDQNVQTWIIQNKTVPHSNEEWLEALNIQTKDRVLLWILENRIFPQSSEEWMEALAFSKPE
ncbi:MAG: hypothetical protein WCK43_01840 [bacterium]